VLSTLLWCGMVLQLGCPCKAISRIGSILAPRVTLPSAQEERPFLPSKIVKETDHCGGPLRTSAIPHEPNATLVILLPGARHHATAAIISRLHRYRFWCRAAELPNHRASTGLTSGTPCFVVPAAGKFAFVAGWLAAGKLATTQGTLLRQELFGTTSYRPNYPHSVRTVA